MQVLIGIFLIVVFVIVFLGSIIGRIIRFFLPSNKQRGGFYQGNKNQNNTYEDPPEEKKVFSDREGEYVNYEEIKEE